MNFCVFVMLQLSRVESLSPRAMAASMLTSTLWVAKSPITATKVSTWTLMFKRQPCVWKKGAGVMLPLHPDAFVSL